jgi:hydrogenase maturation factor
MCLGEVAQVRAVAAGGSLVVDTGQRTATVSSLLLDRVPAAGEWVVAHAGYALAVLTDTEAADALTVRARMNEGTG